MIDFLKYRFICLIASLVLIGTMVGLYFYRINTRGYAFSYSIDFTGGTEVLFKGDKPLDVSAVRSILEGAGWKNPSILEFSGKEELLVRVQEYSNDVKGLAEKMRQTLQDKSPDNKIEILRTDAVGAGVSAELQWNSILAVLISMILMLIYIALTFWSFSFAVGAVVALAHDSLVMLGIFLLLDKEISISVIGAILAVLGYSVNDTIVIFDRMRENMHKMRNMSVYDLANLSLNGTLRRTLLTSFATFITVVIMFIFGGEVLRDFSLALLVGIFFGTYSSIYIASPVMLALKRVMPNA